MLKYIFVILLFFVISYNAFAQPYAFKTAEGKIYKTDLDSSFIPVTNVDHANAICFIYPNYGYKCTCRNGHYPGEKKDYVWFSSNPKPDDRLLDRLPTYVKTKRCLKYIP